MKTVFNSLLVAIALLGLSSCEDPVQVKLDQGSKLYVIDAFVTDQRTAQTIRVTTSDNYFAVGETPAVPNAVVMLKDLTANKSFAFTYGGDGNYVYTLNNPDTIAKVNHQYELDVTIDGQTYTALTVQKRPPIIDSISAEYHEAQTQFGQLRPPRYTCTLWARDKVDYNTDYYWVKTFRNDTLFSKASDINICIDGTGGSVTPDQTSVDSLDFTPPATFLGFQDYPPGSSCKVEIHTLTYDTYNFLLQAINQVNNGGLFATTPENVKTNLVTPPGATIKAVGWFNMATVVSKTKQLPN